MHSANKLWQAAAEQLIATWDGAVVSCAPVLKRDAPVPVLTSLESRNLVPAEYKDYTFSMSHIGCAKSDDKAHWLCVCEQLLSTVHVRHEGCRWLSEAVGWPCHHVSCQGYQAVA